MTAVKVRIRKKPEFILCQTNGLNITRLDKVLVKTEDAIELGVVISNEREVEKTKMTIYKITKKISESDEEKINIIKQKEAHAFHTVKDRARRILPQIKLTDVEFTYDLSKLFIYYTAETRVDFRKFVKDLSHIFKTRIQMVQIGVKDNTRILQGIGVCGRVFCCATILRSLPSISTEMADIQGLTQNLPKLLGVCGKLKCCLIYENQFYQEMLKKMPKLNSKIQTPKGQAIVTAINMLTQKVEVQLQHGEKEIFDLSELQF